MNTEWTEILKIQKWKSPSGIPNETIILINKKYEKFADAVIGQIGDLLLADTEKSLKSGDE